MLTKPATAKSPRKKWDADEVRQLVERQEASGSSLLRYCQDHGLPYTTLTALRRKWCRSGPARDQATASFVPVEVMGPRRQVAVAKPSTGGLHAATMEVRLQHQRAIWVREDFDATALQRLVAVLEQTPC